jgi:hypothetical protein
MQRCKAVFADGDREAVILTPLDATADAEAVVVSDWVGVLVTVFVVLADAPADGLAVAVAGDWVGVLVTVFVVLAETAASADGLPVAVAVSDWTGVFVTVFVMLTDAVSVLPPGDEVTDEEAVLVAPLQRPYEGWQPMLQYSGLVPHHPNLQGMASVPQQHHDEHRTTT